MSAEAKNLKAVRSGEQVILTWETNSTTNLLGFIVEQQVEGGVWAKLQEVAPTLRTLTVTQPKAAKYRVWDDDKVGVTGTVEVPAAPQPPPHKEEPPVKPTSVIIGTNDFSGWQEGPAKTMVAAGIKAGRIEGTGELSKAIGYGAVASEMMVIVGNTSDGSRLSTVNKSAQTAEVVKEAEACAKLGVGLLEFMNEPYLKGASHNKEGAKYAELYLSALAAIEAKGLKVRLLASLDCELSWVEAMPATFWASVQGFTIHPYGSLSWSFGWAGYLKCLEYASKKGANVGWFVSEDGTELNGKTTQYPGFSVPTETERVQLVHAKYETYIASTVAGGCEGIYYYQSHNDSTGTFGFMDNTNKALPLMSTIAAFAA